MTRRGRPGGGFNPYRKPDRYAEAAKEQGYAARSVFKLEEIDRRVQLLKGGMHVLDLGAAPGSWSQYAARRISGSGRLLSVDRNPIAAKLPPHARTVVGDALTLGPELEAFAPYDVVLSDMAPDTTGDRETDKIRSFELTTRAIAVAVALGKPGGGFVGKIFMGRQFEEARALLRRHYAKVRTLRPDAVRGVSYEVFLVGLEKRVTPLGEGEDAGADERDDEA
ncbi:MAG: RlmE family RNA methyltransferase [Deltaproteobacteria bacterium]|nr:RlmE family RNA methyltransferase [Deltaproteobacteria bacterium]